MKYLIIILAVLFSVTLKAQQRFPSGFPTQTNLGWNKWGYAMSDSGLIVANRDTNWLAKYSGTIVFRPANKRFYYFDSTTLLWNQFGTVIDTTSLSNRINLKLNISDTATMLSPYLRAVDTTGKWVTGMYRKTASDSVFYIIGGVSVFGFKDSVGAAGSGLTSVGISMPSGFTVSNSPLVANGTIAISGAGTTLQYIRGNGTLGTFDTAAIPNFYLKVRGLLTGTSPITFNQTTGAIGINNANTSGTKGAASFTAAFSDNGSGLIDLLDLVSAGSCTGCNLNIDAKGRITGYSDGAGGATDNTNVGSGFRVLSNPSTQTLRTLFAGFGTSIDSVSNANGLTWKSDTTRSSGLPTYFYVDSLHDAIEVITADNGLTKTGSNIQLGGALLQNTTIDATTAYFLSVTGSGSVTPFRVSNSGSGNGIFVNTATGTGSAISAQSTNATTLSAFSFGTGYGAAIGSTSNIGLYAYTTSGVSGMAVDVNPSSTNTSQTILQLKRYTSGTAANNIAGRLEFITEPASGTVDVTSGYVESGWEDATFATRKSFMALYTTFNGSTTRKVNISSSGQQTWDGYPALTAQTDSTTYKPIAIDGSGNVVKMANWAGSGGSGTNNTNIGSAFRWLNQGTQEIKTVANSNTILWDSTSTANTLTAKADTSVLATQYDLTQITPSTNLVSDLGRLPQIKTYMPALGTNASATFSASYPVGSIDTAYYAYTASGVGAENGGWLVAGTSGDSAQVTAPFGIVFGNSIMEGHPGRHGRLHPLVGGVAQNAYVYDYPDSVGQISYHLRSLTNMRWYNHGIGGQTTVDLRKRFMRDVAADTVPGMIDSRGNQTLKQRPQIVIIEAGINDIFNGVDAAVTKANLEWMAATCQERNIRCVMLNIPGDAAANQSQLKLIASMNEWFESGVMDQYNASVVDFNLWWNDPDYGGDNIHPTSLIVDDIHPSMVGYDSLANHIFRSARLPVLTRAIFVNELDPGGFTGYSRPANITINGDAYSLSTATDSVDITTFVPDSVWIKVISSTNVTGTTYTGFSHVLWKLDNNVLDSTLFTRRTFYNNSVSYPSLSGVDIIAAKPSNNQLAFRIRMNDLNETFRALTSGGGGTFIFNGLANTTAINSATVSIYNAGANAIGTNGNIKASGTAHQFGVLEINQNSTAGTTGFGISAANSASSLSLIGTASQGMDLLRVTTWNGASSNLGTNPTNLLNITGAGFANSTGINQVGHAISLVHTINNAVGDAGSEVTGVYYNPVRTSLTNTRHVGIFMRSGNNYFNVAGTDSTCFGCDSASNISAKFRINGNIRIDNTLSTPTPTYTVLVHGTDSIVYQVPTSALGGTTLYTGDDTLAGSRNVNANNLNLTFSDVNTFRVNYDMFVQAKADGTFPYTSVITGAAQNYQIAYTPTAGTYSKGSAVLIDTNNNVGLGTLPSSSAPLYTAGNSAYINGLQSQAGNYYRIDNVTSDITIGLTHNFVTIDATGGNVTITLPAASTAFGASMGIDYIFKRLDASGNTVTIQRAGSDTIDGATSFTLTTQWEAKSLRALSASTWGVH